MSFEIKVTGATMQEVINNIHALSDIHKALENSKGQGVKVSAPTLDEPEVSTATASKDKTTLTDTSNAVFHGVEYGPENTDRNLWILLTSGNVIHIPSGGRLPIKAEREKNITKKAFDKIVDEEPERLVKSIGEPEDKETETVKDSGSQEEAQKEEVKNDVAADEGDDLESLIEQAKALEKEAKELDGGKKAVKALLEDYDVKRVSKFDDAEDLADFIEELEEFIEENEE